MAETSTRVSASDVVTGTGLSIAVGAVVGAAAGFLWGGVGGRIAMRVLFLTSRDEVKGLTSDDGFEIGRFSADTIFLLILGAVLGAVIGSMYGMFRMLLVGPVWLIALGMFIMFGVGAGGGSIVSADGIDFRFLDPLWLAVGMFMFLPAAWGATVVLVVDWLLHWSGLSQDPIPGIDARPLGLIGGLVAWGGMCLLTVIGYLDLVEELSRLT